MKGCLLAGDVGGTKTALAIYESTPAGPRQLREATLPSGAYSSLEVLVREVLRESQLRVDRACFAVAGPVERGTARITNLPWTIDARTLASALDIPRVMLLNDVQAAAYGMLFVPPTKFATLRAGTPRSASATVAVIAPGTGLGEALLHWDGVRYRAIASEGGHADFAAQTDDEIRLLRYLQRQFEHVSWERVLSGDGIGSIYSFLRAGGPAEPAWLTERLASGDRNAAVSAVALAEQDPLCVYALDMFCAALGAEAGNLALRGLAIGGVVIGGGIAPKILPLLRRGPFAARFGRKGRFSSWAEGLSVRVALDQQVPLLGAAHWAMSEEAR
jgi:glucokinase